jgi:monothiol glutaredoxin
VSEQEEIFQQIREALEKSPILVFMKGNPTFPQCGFSAQAVQVLESYGIPYKTVDVLANPLLREAIKEFSQWPTIPQVYVGGELVGGSDILLEMHQSGELEPLIRKAVEGQQEASG